MKLGWFGSASLQGTLDRLRLIYGQDKVNEVLHQGEIFHCSIKEAELKLRSPRSPDFYVRNYCKLWLRVKAPNLSIDYLETEINVFIAFVIPTACAAVPFVVRERSSFDIADFGVTAFLILSAFLMLFKINTVRWYETELAISNYLFAHWDGWSETPIV